MAILRAALALFAVIALTPTQSRAQYASSGPLLPSERNETEASRDVAATDYRDAYCAKWTDGCSVCERASANDDPTCRPAGESPGACSRRPVQCQAVLKTIQRVCFAWTDGCNHCVNHYCTAAACPTKPVNYQCRALRTATFQPGDVTGHWRLTGPDQRGCEVVLDGYVTLTGSCLPFGAPIARLTKSKLTRGVLQLLGPDDEPLLGFDVSNPDDLRGVAAAEGYRLVRLEPGTYPPYSWEGSWYLQADGRVCELFLSMRNHRRGQRIEDVQSPHSIAFRSGCVSPTNEEMFAFRRDVPQTPSVAFGRHTRVTIMEPVPVPLWKSWRHEVHDLIFSDSAGKETVFKPQDDGTWRADLSVDEKPLVLRMRRKLQMP